MLVGTQPRGSDVGLADVTAAQSWLSREILWGYGKTVDELSLDELDEVIKLLSADNRIANRRLGKRADTEAEIARIQVEAGIDVQGLIDIAHGVEVDYQGGKLDAVKPVAELERLLDAVRLERDVRSA